jgi:hypothetical protein
MSERTPWVPGNIPWDGGFPYRVLARFGVSPASTGRQVLDVSYDMTPEELSDPSVTAAWESLRTARGRLLVDFFCPELPAPAPGQDAAPTAMPPPLAYLRRLAAELPAGLADGFGIPPVSGELPAVDAALFAPDTKESA